jgi:hypothetical protein
MCKYVLIFVTILLTNLLFGQSHNWDTTVIINKQSLKVETKDFKNKKVLLLAEGKRKKTIIDTLDTGGLLNVELTDFNKDRFSDILITYIGNNPTYFLYLFDPLQWRFRKLEGYDKFPDAVQVKSYPKFYYSYSRAGCADMNWVSDLFRIENYKAIQIGHIYGQGCDFEKDKNTQQVRVYKVLQNDENKTVLLQTIPYWKAVGYDDDKWDFIKAYWNKNFSTFKQ